MRHLLALLLAASLWSASPTAWEMTTYQDFVKGRFSSLALTRDGRVTLAPKLDAVLSTDQAAVWSIARTTGGTVYLGTGHRGKLYRVDPAGKSELVWTSAEAEIFALAVDRQDRVYAATSPNGKIYRIDNGTAIEYFSPNARYIWALVFGGDGALYAATGDEGKIFRVSAKGQGELWYETGQANVTALAIDPKGNLLAGSEPNGIIYRITAKDKAFVLYDADLPEIRALIPVPDGSIYAAAMGGSVVRQTTPAGGTQPSVSSSVQVTAPGTTITVTEEGAAAQQGPQIKPQSATTQTQPAQQTSSTQVTELSGVEKSAVYRINPDNTVETLWSSKEENLYDIAWTNKGLLLATDNQGRIYRLDEPRKATLLVETRESEILRIVPAGAQILAAAGDMGKLFRLGGSVTDSGSFESPAHDASSAARWGRLSWRADTCGGCKLLFRTRTGNSARPDKTWSDWSDPLSDAAGSSISSPNARYIQWKAEFQGAAGAGPSLDSVRLAYLPQNTAPAVKSVTVSAQTASAGAKQAQSSAPTPVYSITVTGTGEAGASSVSGTSTQPLTRASTEQILISWSAEDLDGDKLVYTLEFKGEGDSSWKPLRKSVTDTSYAIDAESLADGRYFFRVTASDRLSNPAQSARESDLTSAPILVDRTPPVIAVNAAALTFEVTDAASPLKGVEYSVDAGPWTPVAPDDGVLDSMRESFTLKPGPLPPGEHMLVIRAYDSANNAGVKKIILR